WIARAFRPDHTPGSDAGSASKGVQRIFTSHRPGSVDPAGPRHRSLRAAINVLGALDRWNRGNARSAPVRVCGSVSARISPVPGGTLAHQAGPGLWTRHYEQLGDDCLCSVLSG